MDRMFRNRRPNEVRAQLLIKVSNAIEESMPANERFAPRDRLAAIWTFETLKDFFWHHRLSLSPVSIHRIRSDFLQTISILIYIKWDGWPRFDEVFLSYEGPMETRDRTDRRIRHYDIQTLKRDDFLGPEAGGQFLHMRSVFCPIYIEEGSDSVWEHGERLPFLAAKSQLRGRGGFGKVTKEVIAAKHYCTKSGIQMPEVEVARKVFTSKIDFDREKWNLNRLAECVAQHKHIVLPLATITVGNQFNILFPLAQMDLEKFLQGHLRHPEMCEMNDIIDEAINVVDALDHLHDRLGVSIHGYHMDVKPANILVYEDSGHREQSGVGSWKITDFGLSIIARAGRRGSADGLPQDRVTETRTHLLRREGTYQAPEVCSGPGPCRRSDIWSFGCILVRVLAFKLDGIDGLRALDDLRRLDNDGIGYYEDDHFTRGNPPVLNPHIENWITGLAQGNRQGYPDEFLHGCAKMLLSILQTDKNARPLARDVKEELGSLKAYLNIPQQPDSASDSSSGSGDESSPSLPPSTEPSTVYANSPDLAFLTDRLIQDIKNNDITGVEQILSLRVNIDRANESNETPLGVAVEQGNEEVLELLLNATANVDARSAGGKTPLLIAIRKGHDRIAQILLDQGANSKVYSDEGLTCLHYATWPQTSAGLLRLLIAQVRRINIDIDIPTHDGTHRTPLMMLLKHFADDRDWEAKFNGLVEAGADVNRRDANDISPLRCAVTEGSTTAVRLLIEQGANLEDFSAVHPKNNAIKTEFQRAYETRRRGSLASSRSRRSLWSWSLIRRVFSS